MKLSRIGAVFTAVCLLGLYSLLGGCASGNVVHLAYPAEKNARQPVTEPANDILVCVVDFVNKREQAAIGQRLDGQKLVARTPVDRWLASSLAEELKRAGYRRAIVVETLEEALALSPGFIITGESAEVWLAETSLTRYTGSIRASISLLDGQGRDITKNCYNSVYSKTVLPVYGVPQTLLDEALSEMLEPASKLLAHMMR